MAVCNEMKWFDELSLIRLGRRSSCKEDILGTPVEMVYGQNLHLSGDLLTPSSGTNSSEVNNRKHKYLYNCNKSSSATDNSKDYVFAKSQFDELAALYQSMGKWRVLINIAFRYLGHILSQDFSNKSAVNVDPEKNWSASWIKLN
uniref:Uncharacterized protein n=1 Tax=Glossina palpalis gambiensis TaxID=67801 RepID=A0A1B0BIF2_9MUSC